MLFSFRNCNSQHEATHFRQIKINFNYIEARHSLHTHTLYLRLSLVCASALERALTSLFLAQIILRIFDLLLHVRLEAAQRLLQPLRRHSDQLLLLGNGATAIVRAQHHLGGPAQRVRVGQPLDQLLVVGQVSQNQLQHHRESGSGRRVRASRTGRSCTS